MDESDSALSDSELDEELALPSVLSGLDIDEKRSLFEFKSTHSEREWEEEVLRRQELLTKQLDMQRLVRMARPSKSDDLVGKRNRLSHKKEKESKRKRIEDDSDSSQGSDDCVEADEKDEIFVTMDKTTSIDPQILSDGSEDELFDSEEEEEQNKKFTVSDLESKPTRAAPIGKKMDQGKSMKSNLESFRFDGDSGEEDGEILEAPHKRKESDDHGDSDYYSEDDSVDSRRNDHQSKPQSEVVSNSPEAQLSDYLTLQLRRSYLEKWVREPFFESAVLRMFVRLFVGEKDGIAIYRMAEVKSVENGGRPYRLPDSKLQTTIRLVLDIAGSEKKHVKMDLVSNSRITQGELDVYLSHVRATRNYKPLTLAKVQARRLSQQKALRHKYTPQEISAMVKKNLGLNVAIVTEQSTAMERLLKRREKAIESDDLDDLEVVNKAIEKLESEIQAEKDLFERSQSFKYVSLNKRNKDLNFEKDLQAGISKRIQDQASSAAIQDPFVRRETRPRNLWKTGNELKIGKLKLEHSKLLLDMQKKNDPSDIQDLESIRSRIAHIDAEIKALESEEAFEPKKPSKPSTSLTAAVSGGAGEQDRKLDRGWKLERVSMDEIRSRVKQRLGVDPYELVKIEKRERYLRAVCNNLPALGSQDRELVRGGLPLADIA